MLRQLAAQFPDRYPALLESVAVGPTHRYSLLFGGITASILRRPDGELVLSSGASGAGGFLDHLDRLHGSREGAPLPSPGLPFVGGWVVLAGYELAAEIEPRLRLPRGPTPFDSLALRTTCALVFDHETGRLTAVAECDAGAALEQAVADVRDSRMATPLRRIGTGTVLEEDPARYLDMVRRAKEYIAAGDVYQVNLSRGWRVTYPEPVPPMALYERLRQANPAPFAACLQWQGVAIVSSSPERLLAIEGRNISTRPIAGTRPRSRADDRGETRELVAHPKERAEHVMLIDLERNDLGRVCEGGTVVVDELMVTESYAHVHHIVSNVRGRLRADVSPIAALRALFPGGTITGCPKIRCMEIIAELEGGARGAYTGSLGYISLNGRADFNILIRTMCIQDRTVELRAGAGVVADSIPERELDETRAKARGLLAAIESQGAPQ